MVRKDIVLTACREIHGTKQNMMILVGKYKLNLEEIAYFLSIMTYSDFAGKWV